MTIALRHYQRASIDALYDYWASGGGNGLIVIPTAGGKSLTIAQLVRELIGQFPSIRIGIITHVKELIGQNFAELIRLWPAAPAGIYSAGLHRRDARSQILFGGIQSIWNKVHSIGSFDLLIIDEAHLVGRKAESMYGKFIERLRDDTPDLRIVGYTATAFRMDSGRLDQGEGAIFDKVVYEYGIVDGINDGFLCPPISKATAMTIDVSKVGSRGGDYIPSQLEVAVDTDFITTAAVNEIVAFGADRKGWLVFCAGVDHARHVCIEICNRGIDAEFVTGETPSGDRDRIIRAFKSRRLRCLVFVNVGTTGFNATHVDLIAGLRPTQSKGLYLQIVGRGLRLDPGKSNCLILDFASWVKTHGPIDAIIPGKAKRKGEAEAVLAKECPNCHSLIAIAAKQCPHCDYVYPVKEPDLLPNHDAHADAERPILSTAQPTWMAVSGMRAYRHEKPDQPTSMRVEYHCGITTQREWVSLERTGGARAHAERWWRNAGGAMPVPATVDEGIARFGELRAVEAIQIRPSGRYFEIVGRRLKQTKTEVAA